MKSFLQFCEDARDKLGRQLDESEISFLYWIYQRYEQEQKDIHYIH